MVPTGPTIRRRLAVLAIAIAALFFLVSVQLFRLQVVYAFDLQARAQSQWTSRSVLSPRRGTLYDAGGHALAMSATAYMVSVNPRQVKQPEAFARAVAPVLGLDEASVAKKAADRTKGGVTLKRQVSREIADQLRTQANELRAKGDSTLTGLYFEEDNRRIYPMGTFLSQVLGLTTIDGVGQAGLEQSLDKYLSGKAGSILSEVDGKGRELPYSVAEYVPPVNGSDVILTIDYVLQSYLEKAMRECMSINKAVSVMGLMMNVKTGEILAMSIKPDFDPNDPPRSDVEALSQMMRIRLITDVYEPGSTFKILTTAAALDAKVTTPTEGFYCSGSVVVDGGRIKCWGKPHGAETMRQGLQNSCNPVFVELGLRLGTERFYKYMRAYGLTEQTGIDLAGESPGLLIPEKNVKRVDMARIGFGQSVAITPLQLLTAACSVVNGGSRMKPYIIKEIRSPEGDTLLKNEPVVVDQPISPETSKLMCDMLEGVVSEGGGRNAFVEGYRIGGKTGTAQLYRDGVIVHDAHIGSFLGVAPADDPQIALLVIVGESQLRPDFGSITAAPYAKQVLEDSLAYLGVKKADTAAPLPSLRMPKVSDMPLTDATTALQSLGIQYELMGAGSRVIDQLPAEGAVVKQGSLCMLYLDGETPTEGMTTVPDVTGMSIQEAGRNMEACGLSLVIDGSGIAVAQEPAAGEQVPVQTQVKVTFQVP